MPLDRFAVAALVCAASAAFLAPASHALAVTLAALANLLAWWGTRRANTAAQQLALFVTAAALAAVALHGTGHVPLAIGVLLAAGCWPFANTLTPFAGYRANHAAPVFAIIGALLVIFELQLGDAGVAAAAAALLCAFWGLESYHLAIDAHDVVRERRESWTLTPGEAAPALEGDSAPLPHVLLFGRGGWCPTGHALLRDFDRAAREMDGTVIAYVGDSVEGASALASRLRLTMPVVADPNGEAAARFGAATLQPIDDDELRRLPLPAWFAIGDDGRVRATSDSRRLGIPLDPTEAIAASRQPAEITPLS